MATVGQDRAQPVGDAALVQQYAAGDDLAAADLAAADLIARHRDAVADSGPSPFFESLDLSGERALFQLRAFGPDLPFRATWLALHTQGALPADEERRNPAWDAFRTLPLAEQTALWHREVEGQEVTEVSRLLGTTTDEVRRDLASAYATVRARVEQVPATSRGVASHLLLLQYSLRDTLAGVVLGPAAGRYLAARPRVGRRVPIDARPTPHPRPAPYVAGLAAALVGVAAAVSFLLGSAPVATSNLPAAQAAPFDAPVVGSYLEAVAPPTKPAEDRGPVAATTGTSSPVRTVSTSTATTGGGRGSGGTNAGPSGGAPNGGHTPQPGGTHQPGPAPADHDPGQGLHHASDQGVAHGVRAHGHGDAHGHGHGFGHGNQGNNPGKARGSSHGKFKGKARGHR